MPEIVKDAIEHGLSIEAMNAESSIEPCTLVRQYDQCRNATHHQCVIFRNRRYIVHTGNLMGWEILAVLTKEH